MYALGDMIVFTIGLFAAWRAGWWFWFFSRSDRDSRWAIMGLMAEQVVSVTGTVLFSINSMVNLALFSVEPGSLAAMAIRITMFYAMIHSTQRMSQEYYRVLRENQELREWKQTDAHSHD